jgi:membrane protease YdiL (CAAX protease family)
MRTALKSAQPSWRPAAAALGTFAVLLACSPLFFWAGNVLETLTTFSFVPGLRRAGAPTAAASHGLGALLIELVLIPTALMLGAVQERDLGSALRLRLPKVTPSVWLALVLVPLSVDVAADSLEALLPWWPQEIGGYPPFGLMPLLTGVLVAPLGEELFFRGLLQTSISRRWGSAPAVLVSALAFSAWHEDLGAAHVLFLAGVAMAWSTEMSGSIAPAIVAHAINNLLAMLPFSASAHGIPTSAHLAILAPAACALSLSAAVIARDRNRTRPSPPT